MRRTKHRIETLSYLIHTGISRHLEKMAAIGWMIEKIVRTNLSGKNTEIRVSFFFFIIKKQDSSLDGCEWLYSEIYRHYLGYEVHILFQKRKGLDLVELIIQCRDISITVQDAIPNNKRR